MENGARGGTEDVVRRAAPHLKAEYLFAPVGNKSAALNAALGEVGDALVVFLDDDVRVPRDLLILYEQAAKAIGEGAFFGGPVAPDYEAPPLPWVVDLLPPSAKGWKLDDATQPVRKPLFLGFNWAAYARDIRALGGFSEHFGPGAATGSIGQESQMQRRLIAAGVLGRYVPNALVYHWVPRERCSPEFALERTYRNGIRSGLLREDDHGLAISGYPLSLVRRAIESWCNRWLQRVRGNRERAFLADVAYHHRSGVLRGVTLRRRGALAADATAGAGE